MFKGYVIWELTDGDFGVRSVRVWVGKVRNLNFGFCICMDFNLDLIGFFRCFNFENSGLGYVVLLEGIEVF